MAVLLQAGLVCNLFVAGEGSESQVGVEVGVYPVGVEGASQDPTAQLLISSHPVATAALAPLPAAARSASQNPLPLSLKRLMKYT